MNLSGDALDDVKHVCWVEDEHIAQKPSYSHQVPKVGQWYINAVVVGKASFFSLQFNKLVSRLLKSLDLNTCYKMDQLTDLVKSLI